MLNYLTFRYTFLLLLILSNNSYTLDNDKEAVLIKYIEDLSLQIPSNLGKLSFRFQSAEARKKFCEQRSFKQNPALNKKVQTLLNINKIEAVISDTATGVIAFSEYGLLVFPNNLAHSFLEEKIINDKDIFAIHYQVAQMWISLHLNRTSNDNVKNAISRYIIDYGASINEQGCLDTFAGDPEKIVQCRRHRTRSSNSIIRSKPTTNNNDLKNYITIGITSFTAGICIGAIIAGTRPVLGLPLVIIPEPN